MQNTLLDILILGLLVLLFGSIYRTRPSARLRYWIIGWLCVLAHFTILLISPASDRGVALVASRWLKHPAVKRRLLHAGRAPRQAWSKGRNSIRRAAFVSCHPVYLCCSLRRVRAPVLIALAILAEAVVIVASPSVAPLSARPGADSRFKPDNHSVDRVARDP